MGRDYRIGRNGEVDHNIWGSRRPLLAPWNTSNRFCNLRLQGPPPSTKIPACSLHGGDDEHPLKMKESTLLRKTHFLLCRRHNSSHHHHHLLLLQSKTHRCCTPSWFLGPPSLSFLFSSLCNTLRPSATHPREEIKQQKEQHPKTKKLQHES